jgi:hypothetical protein
MRCGHINILIFHLMVMLTHFLLILSLFIVFHHLHLILIDILSNIHPIVTFIHSSHLFFLLFHVLNFVLLIIIVFKDKFESVPPLVFPNLPRKFILVQTETHILKIAPLPPLHLYQ